MKLAIILFAIQVMMLSTACSTDYGKIQTEKELYKLLGEPDEMDTITLCPSRDISLHEYQSGLYKYIPSSDSIDVIEARYIKKHNHQVIWYIKQTCDSIKVIDELSWDDRYVNY
jgi:hypothetical protein